ncbi:MAG: glucosamine-6-phosphate deaminase [Christensenellales bacterium]
MNYISASSYEDMSLQAADIIALQLAQKPDSILGLATGSTPIGTYGNLVQMKKRGEIDLSMITTFNLDEYCGLPPENEQSFRNYMNRNLFWETGLCPLKTNIPDGMATDLKAECKRYDGLLKDSGGVDLQLLGIGHNGHIGFNEPCEALEKGTHVTKLSESTIKANSRFFLSEDQVPKYAITMGIDNIMSAKRILLLACGEGKRDILKRALYGPITPMVPASFLQSHGALTVIYSP